MADPEFNAFYKGKRVLVTGHTGFKGSWLTEWLLMLGSDVTGLSLAPATEPALFDQLGLAGRCDHRLGDIRDRDLVSRVIRQVRPDVVFHLAAQPLVRCSYAQPLETYATNVMGTAHVLEGLRAADWLCAAVMITTDKVYENRETGHAYRESDPLGGYDPYSSSKACAELIIQSYRQSFFNPVRLLGSARRTPSQGGAAARVAVASARAGNVIGGGDWAQDRIVPDCIRALAKGETIVVRNPEATRPWQHVLDPLSGYLLLGMRLHEALAAKDARLASYASSFNFGPDAASNRSVREVVEEVLKHWPGAWRDGRDPRAPHEAGLLNLATAKAAQVLDWRPRWDFRSAVEATVSWYREAQRSKPGVMTDLTRAQIAANKG